MATMKVKASWYCAVDLSIYDDPKIHSVLNPQGERARAVPGLASAGKRRRL